MGRAIGAAARVPGCGPSPGLAGGLGATTLGGRGRAPILVAAPGRGSHGNRLQPWLCGASKRADRPALGAGGGRAGPPPPPRFFLVVPACLARSASPHPHLPEPVRRGSLGHVPGERVGRAAGVTRLRPLGARRLARHLPASGPSPPSAPAHSTGGLGILPGETGPEERRARPNRCQLSHPELPRLLWGLARAPDRAPDPLLAQFPPGDGASLSSCVEATTSSEKSALRTALATPCEAARRGASGRIRTLLGLHPAAPWPLSPIPGSCSASPSQQVRGWQKAVCGLRGSLGWYRLSPPPPLNHPGRRDGHLLSHTLISRFAPAPASQLGTRPSRGPSPGMRLAGCEGVASFRPAALWVPPTRRGCPGLWPAGAWCPQRDE